MPPTAAFEEDRSLGTRSSVLLYESIPTAEVVSISQAAILAAFDQTSFEGGVYDASNLASTYAAICMLKTLGDDLSRLNKPAIIGALRHLQNKKTGW